MAVDKGQFQWPEAGHSLELVFKKYSNAKVGTGKKNLKVED